MEELLQVLNVTVQHALLLSKHELLLSKLEVLKNTVRGYHGTILMVSQ
jgi:hypothetical protein